MLVKETLMRLNPTWLRAALIAAVSAIVLITFVRAQSNDPVAADAANISKVIAAARQYAQDYDATLPVFHSEAEFEIALAPYTRDHSLFVAPSTGKSYAVNTALSGQPLYSITDPHTTPVVQDAVPLADGKLTIGYLDGHVEHGGVDTRNADQVGVDNAKFVALGLLMYTQDYDEVLPPMHNAVEFQTDLLPYIKDPNAFVIPANGQLFAPNSAIGEMSIASFTNPATTIIFQDPKPADSRHNTVAFLDGHVEFGGVNQGTYSGSGRQKSNSDIANIKQLALGVGMYIQDYDEVLPPMDNYATFKQVVLPYLKSDSLFYQPSSGLPYVLNTSLSEVSFANIQSPAETELLRDPVPNSAGFVAVAFADFHVKSVGPFPDSGFNGRTDLLWQNSKTGNVTLWKMNKAQVVTKTSLASGLKPDQQIVGTADFNADGHLDFLWRNTKTGDLYVWFMNGTKHTGTATIQTAIPLAWRVAATGDFNRDGHPDILWQNTQNGNVVVWHMNGLQQIDSASVASGIGAAWRIAGTADFYGDGYPAILWQNDQTGQVTIWRMKDTQQMSSSVLVTKAPLSWKVNVAANLNSDAQPHLVWRNINTNQFTVWYLDGGGLITTVPFVSGISGDWRLIGPK